MFNLVDASRSYTNNMWDNYTYYGIEGARAFLLTEFTNLVNTSCSGNIAPHHINTLVDTMTHKGTITSISRYGIDRDVGPLAKGSFEDSVDNFLRAGFYSEREHLKGISASVICGSHISSGTTHADVKFDFSKLDAAIGEKKNTSFPPPSAATVDSGGDDRFFSVSKLPFDLPFPRLISCSHRAAQQPLPVVNSEKEREQTTTEEEEAEEEWITRDDSVMSDETIPVIDDETLLSSHPRHCHFAPTVATVIGDDEASDEDDDAAVQQQDDAAQIHVE
jgi:hypothetical protein